METSKQNYGKFRKILTVGDHLNLRISLSSREASFVLQGERVGRKKDRARGARWEGGKQKRRLG